MRDYGALGDTTSIGWERSRRHFAQLQATDSEIYWPTTTAAPLFDTVITFPSFRPPKWGENETIKMISNRSHI